MYLENDLISRRDLLKSGGAFALLLAAGCTPQQINDINNRPTRRNIANLAPNDPILQTYAEAIKKMKALPSSDPRNWENQASIHYNRCSHQNWWLLPWHRWYLWYFERICQKLTGNQDFALPYWNWTTNPAVPDVFWDSSSQLYDSTRVIQQGVPISAEFVSHSVLEGILEEPNFQVFGSYAATGQQDGVGAGPLEARPHNNVHTEIGGNMGAFHSPRDPVFWTHHAMLDFCWVDWNLNRGNAVPSDPQWQDLAFTDFFDENGSPVKVLAGASVFFPIIFYQYEPSQIGNTVVEPIKFASHRQADEKKKLVQRGASSQISILQRFPTEQHMEVSVRQPATAPITLQSGVIRTAVEGQGVGRVLLTLGNVQVPSKADFFARVFVNADAGVSPETPITDPHYAGSFAFFFGNHGAPGTSHPQAAFVVDVTQALRRLSRAGALSEDRIGISLVAVPYSGRTIEVRSFTLERLELAVTR